MDAMLLRYLLVTLVLLFQRSWVCGCTEIATSCTLSTCAATSVHRRDGHLENEYALKRWTPRAAAASPALNLPFATASPADGHTSSKGSDRLLQEVAEVTKTTSSEEVVVLTAFKSEITSDPLGTMSSWLANDSDACGWAGVSCSKNSKHVATLNLKGLQLVGTISALLGQLSFLQRLDLSNNLFHGPIPPSLANCSDLLYLNMSFNHMSGNIPTQMGELENLQTLDVSTNNLTGEIPVTLGNCSLLQHLDLGTNTFDGGIPFQVGQLSRLQFLSLVNSSISGSIPSVLGNCSSLTTLSLSYNSNLGGQVPVTLQELHQLENFHLFGCNFVGTFPTWVPNLTAMQSLSLGSNQFSGQIPETIGQLPDLSYLNLRENSFSGEIPRSIVNNTALVVLIIDQNLLGGTVPSDIGMLNNLEVFFVYTNALTGLIPPSLSNCSGMMYFMIGDNPFHPQVLPSWIASFQNLKFTYFPQMNLYGEIPPEIGQLPQLIEFLLWENSLNGTIPASLGNCTSLVNLDLRTNLLTGDIPPELGLLPLQDLQIGGNLFPPGPFPAFIYNLTQIELLGIWSNQFTGKLDGDFGSFGQLQTFEAFDNDFTGPIPEGLTNCSELQMLQLTGNSLSGGIPAGFANLTNFNNLMLDSNYLTGGIPADIVRIPQLTFLSLSGNKLGGNIPTDIGQLLFLQDLYLNGTNLTGTLPESLGNCTQLLSLDLSQNSLSGTIPGSALAGIFSALNVLDLSHNLFSGTLPLELGRLTNIQEINVSGNNLSGSIPSTLVECKALRSLDISLNHLTGELPGGLGALANLTAFNASYNFLEGPIPDSGFFTSSYLTAASFLGNPGLCGGVLGPQRQCPVAAAPSPLSRRSSHCKGPTCDWIWISVVSSILFVLLIVGVALCVIVYRVNAKKASSVHHSLHMFTVDPRMRFTERDILAAIAAGHETVIGVGAKGTVYKTVLPGGETIAIKVLRNPQKGDQPDSEDEKRWEMEISSEANTLAKLRHRNVIKVYGLVATSEMAAIVLQYMPQGSLYAHLHDCDKCVLTWDERFSILLGVTHAMVYLHHEFPETIIHRDLKSSNILLDAHLEPKVCDFGISKFVARDSGEASASTFGGTFGYIPPEYGTGATVSTKGDVYSYGIVLLELLTAKPVIQTDSMRSYSENGTLVGLVERCFKESESLAFQLLDPTLQHEGTTNPRTPEKMMLTLRVGLLCTKAKPESRPSMNDVLTMLLDINVAQGSVIPKTIDDLLSDYIVVDSTTKS